MYILPLYCCKFKYEPAPVLEGYFCDFYHKYSPVAKYIFFLKYTYATVLYERGNTLGSIKELDYTTGLLTYLFHILSGDCWVWLIPKGQLISKLWARAEIVKFFRWYFGLNDDTQKTTVHCSVANWNIFLKMEELFVDQISCSLIYGLLWPH